MKNILLIGLVCTFVSAYSQTKSEKITRELAFEKPGPSSALIIANIFGHVEVEGYNGDKIMVEVEKTVSGKTQQRFETGWKEVDLGVIDRADTVVLYVKGVTPGFGRRKNRNNDEPGGWGYEWNDPNEDEKTYDYKMNFHVKVPAATNVIVSTVNDGDVKISNVAGKLVANNINGGIALDGVSDGTRARTINGDVDVSYQQNPSSDCRFYSLNGDINAFFKKGLSSTVSFKSFNGEFYTNLSQLEQLPVEVEKSKTDQGIKYKVNGNQYKSGKGGVHLDFETFNGNVYLREQ